MLPSAKQGRPEGWFSRTATSEPWSSKDSIFEIHADPVLNCKSCRLDSRNRAAVNDVLRTGDRASQRRGNKSNEVCYLFWLGRPSDRNAAEGFHQALTRTFVIRARLLCQFCDQSNGCFRLHPAGRNPDHADTEHHGLLVALRFRLSQPVNRLVLEVRTQSIPALIDAVERYHH